MKLNGNVQILKTSLRSNLWVHRWTFVLCLIIVVCSIIGEVNFVQFIEIALVLFLFSGIFFFGFVGIALHLRYYLHYEKGREVKLFEDHITVIDEYGVNQIFKKEVAKIMLFNNIKYNDYNLFPTSIDRFYYLTIIAENGEQLILTCILDTKLKKKIVEWYGREPEHKYQFFPFPQAIANKNI